MKDNIQIDLHCKSCQNLTLDAKVKYKVNVLKQNHVWTKENVKRQQICHCVSAPESYNWREVPHRLKQFYWLQWTVLVCARGLSVLSTKRQTSVNADEQLRLPNISQY